MGKYLLELINENFRRCVFLLTSIVSLLILVGKKMRKPFKSCGESCECIDEEMLGYEGSTSLNYRGDCL